MTKHNKKDFLVLIIVYVRLICPFSRYGSNLFISMNQSHCKPHSLCISPAVKWATILECELHVLSLSSMFLINDFQTSSRVLYRKMGLTYVNINLKFRSFTF